MAPRLLMATFVSCALPAMADSSGAAEQLAAMRVEVSSDRLVQYAAQGDETVVKLLLQAGVAVTAQEPKRQVTALHNASAQGHAKLAAYLLAQGANVDAQDWSGTTPLIAAAFCGKPELVRLLLAQEARVDVVPARAPTALVAAVYSGNAKAVELLLEAGADPRRADIFGTTALEAATRANRTELITQLQQASDAAKH